MSIANADVAPQTWMHVNNEPMLGSFLSDSTILNSGGMSARCWPCGGGLSTIFLTVRTIPYNKVRTEMFVSPTLKVSA